MKKSKKQLYYITKLIMHIPLSMYSIAVKARKNAAKPQKGGVIKRKKVFLF